MSSSPDSGPIPVVIADDHSVVRHGLRLLLDGDERFEVVAEAEDLEGTRRRLLGHRPAVLVIDLSMPGASTLEALPALRAEFPDTEIVVLTASEDPEHARAALGAGVLGYVLKEAAETELLSAVAAAARGESFLNPRLGAALAAAPPPGPPGGLTPREAEILGLIALGHTNAQIGERLFISIRTVETHRASIQQKLGLSDRSALVRFAFDHGLISGRG